MTDAIEYSEALYKKLILTVGKPGRSGHKEIDLKRYLIPGPAKVSYCLYAEFPGSKVGDSNYFRLYRRFKYLEKAGLITLERGRSGYVPYEKEGLYASPRARLLDLIKQVQNSNQQVKSAKQTIDPLYRIPQRCRPERIESIKTMMSIRGRRLYQRQDKSRINKELSDYIGKMDDRFEDYSEVVKELRILLRHKTDKDQVLTLPFRTRFNDLGRKTKNLKEFEAGWDKSLIMAKRAVFLTLTTDPGDNDTMWRRNRHMGKAFNRYQSYLGKRHQIQYRYFLETDLRTQFCKIHNISRIETREQHLKYERFIRPHKKEIKAQMKGISFRRKYICVNEFQENGLIHSHIVIFGIRWLAEKETISQDWQRCEQGRIVHIYAMTNDGKRWLWSREKPTDSEGKAPEEYLKKYLGRVQPLLDRKQALLFHVQDIPVSPQEDRPGLHLDLHRKLGGV